MDKAIKHKHYIIHKPFNFHSQFKLETNKKKQLLGELHDFAPGTMAIGRLDKDSEGLLLLTTDGKMSELVRSKKVEKEYHVQVDGLITQEAIAKLKAGVEIGFEGGKITPNPSNGNINYVLQQSFFIEESTVSILNMNGKTLYAFQNITNSHGILMLDNLNTGLYIVQILNGIEQINHTINIFRN